MELQGKKVLVFGSGKSGIGASDLLAKVGAFPVIYDGNAETDKDAVVHKTDGTYPVTVYAGELPKEVQDSLDLVVLSPGVPTSTGDEAKFCNCCRNQQFSAGND